MAKNIKSRPLNDSQWNEIYGKYHCAVDLMLQTGCRISEAFELINNWDGVSTEHWMETKHSGKEKNRFDLSPTIIKTLKECQKVVKGKMQMRTFTKIFEEIKDIYGWEWFTSHSLRTTFCTRLHKRGVPLATISFLMHHKSLDMTAQYIWTSREDAIAALDYGLELNTQAGKTGLEWAKSEYLARVEMIRLEDEVAMLRKQLAERDEK